LFSLSLSYFDAPASLSAIAIAWRRFLTLPALPPGPLLSSPCLNSCITRPSVFRCRGEDLGMACLRYVQNHPLAANVRAVRRFQAPANRRCRGPTDQLISSLTRP